MNRLKAVYLEFPFLAKFPPVEGVSCVFPGQGECGGLCGGFVQGQGCGWRGKAGQAQRGHEGALKGACSHFLPRRVFFPT